MKHVDMRSNMEHFSKVILTMKIMGFFQEFLMILNK